MLRAKLTLRPSEAGLKFDTQEISDFAIYAVTYFTLKLTLRVADPQSSLQWYGQIHLNASARQRYVFQVGYRAPCSAILVFPLDIDKIRAQHPRLHSAVLHIQTNYRPCSSKGLAQTGVLFTLVLIRC